MNRYANAVASATGPIDVARKSLDAALAAAGWDGLDGEQIDALEDVTQWPGMLDDFEARLGVDVTEARAVLTGCINERIEGLEAQLDALPESNRDEFAKLAGELQDLRDIIAPPLFLNEFPEFDAASDCHALLRDGFKDTSWHNDAMPSFSRGRNHVFVDYRDPELSEFRQPGDRFVWVELNAKGEFTDETKSFATITELTVFLSGRPK